MKLKTSSVSTLLFLIFVRKSLAQVITTGQSRQGNEITFTCESFDQEAIKIRVVSVIADGSNGTAPFVNVSRTSTTAMARFTVTPSDEKAAYCGAGNVSTNLVYFGGEYKIIVCTFCLATAQFLSLHGQFLYPSELYVFHKYSISCSENNFNKTTCNCWKCTYTRMFL